uniref:Serine proteinase n=1 Tax=Herdmania momus TaxID=7733 RepID=Q25101_HERMO|nr:serine proteinase [Herdmania momus]
MKTVFALVIWIIIAGFVESNSECFDIENPESYQGAISRTLGGETCQSWDLQTPHKHKYTSSNYPNSGLAGNNYCRNPDQDWRGPWCYTTNEFMRWDYCDIPICSNPPPVTLPPSIECGKTTEPLSDATKGYDLKQSKAKTNPLHIVGGTTVTHGSIPWQVSLRLKRELRHFCGGSILNRNWILTAAHCIRKPQQPKKYLAILGDYDRIQYDFSEMKVGFRLIFNHEKYNPATFENDITLMKMDTSISIATIFGQSVFPPANKVPAAKSKIIVSGWGDTKGTTQDVKLNQVTLPVMSFKLCKKLYSKVVGAAPVFKTSLCAAYKKGGKDSCQGDSGGPLVQKSKSGNWQVVGIVSWGVGCALERKPSVNTMVSKYIDWIENKMNNF